ncbi:hypothetical protein HMP09_1346 [Sphingomonas sp. HMP9]|uniref:hypothetical protein n=1 Tax=Sphingomonas sp. HMP9 TaxID=1517554 RepID=UPI00159661CD|nr:hypothetical protein [Sphingomonas sp. HMP9]BCA62112.1 hypothetical protein HMP09_1346 [Sphingomonas sp. HMP9]
MSTRYQQLRAAVANLAAPADLQATYLDGIFVLCTGGGSAEGYGNIELVEEFYDIFLARNHMFEFEEIRPSEVEAVIKLDKILSLICAEQDDRLWAREALFSDERWTKIRSYASKVLKELPDEPRESDYTRGLSGGDS